MTISRQECLKTYKDILDNSDSKWESGKSLAKIRDFGGATSLAIISIEELIKSLVIFFDGHGFNFRSIKGIRTLFDNHQIRYVIAYGMFAFGIVGEDILKFLQDLRRDPSLIEIMMENFKSQNKEFGEKITSYLQKKLEVLNEELDWFSKIDIFRQDGFYCDYEEQFKSPIKISEDEYNQVIIRLDKVRKMGRIFIDVFETQDNILIDHLEQIKKDFKTNDYYGKISDVLIGLKMKRENPFAVIKSKISDSFLSEV